MSAKLRSFPIKRIDWKRSPADQVGVWMATTQRWVFAIDKVNHDELGESWTLLAYDRYKPCDESSMGTKRAAIPFLKSDNYAKSIAEMMEQGSHLYKRRETDHDAAS